MLLPITIDLIQISLGVTAFGIIVTAFLRFMGEIIGGTD